jgi:hypothetical protein
MTECYAFAVCTCLSVRLGPTDLWELQILYRGQGQEGRGSSLCSLT